MSKPIVDGLEKALQGQAPVLRLDVMSQLGREIAIRYQIRGVPTFLVFDGKGNVVYQQVGPSNRGAIIQVVQGGSG